MEINRENKIDMYEIYGKLLADKQKKYFNFYYIEDYSLGEIAEIFDVSRQAVLSGLDNAVEKLMYYEEKMNLLMKRRKEKNIIKKIENLKINKENENFKKYISELRRLYV